MPTPRKTTIAKPARKPAAKPARTTKAAKTAPTRRSAAIAAAEAQGAAGTASDHGRRAGAGGTRLVIVESPAKARTIAPLLGRSYSVKASLGHVRDLPKSRIGVEPERNFEPKYLVPREKKSVVDDLKDAARRASAVFLATDPDREGEAISWHLLEAADIHDVPVRRVEFHEITPQAIAEAFQHPRDINMDLVNAQQARRILDRLVGYNLSPVLWRKVRGGLSAGRVQSAALRMVVEREREIDNFVPREYWSIEAELAKEALGARRTRADSFKAALVNRAGQRGRIEIPDKASADNLLADLRPASYKVKSVTKRNASRQPEPPFTTSTLQQEAARKLHFTAQRTMMVAQQLYEGLDIGERSPVGLITYMRTDSVRMAESAIEQMREYIQRAYGADFLPAKPRQFTTRARGAQEAHEAIRPTSALREPDQLKARLSPEQFRLYELIWKRAVASQMAAASLENTAVEIDALNSASGSAYLFRATNSIVTFPGYQVLYSEGTDDDQAPGEGENRTRLPQLAQGDPLSLVGIEGKQHFTQPPPRYTDATLVKALEANGIGRPSTYAAILSTLQERGYVKKDRRQFVPQELGYLVNDLLTEHFPEIVDVGFTAKMEDELDDIAAGKRAWVPVLREFYGPFHATVERANTVIPKVIQAPEPTGEACELCGRPMVFRMGRFGRFQACSGFPECRNTKPILKMVGVNCPKDGGPLVEKRSKRGRVFYGCANFPNCDFTTWDKPVPEPCPNCGGLMVEPRRNVVKCTQCDYTNAAGAALAPSRNGRSKGHTPELTAATAGG